MRYPSSVVGLTALWLLAWGTVDPVQVVAGLVLSIVILEAMPARHRFTPGVRVSFIGALQLIGHLAVSLVVSTVVVAREILSPRQQPRTGRMVHEMPGASPEAVSLLANTIALTPGTMTIEATAEPPLVVVHFIRYDDPEASRRSIEQLDARVRAALSGGKVDQRAQPAVDPGTETGDGP